MLDAKKMIEAVNAYVAGFERKDGEAIAALYAQECTVEDPVGSPPKRGLEEVRAFYIKAMESDAKLTLHGPVRTAGCYAAFSFSVHLFKDGPKRIDVIDTFKFDEDGRIVAMRAFWGPPNFHSL